MPFTIDDANLPATLTAQPMSDEEFMEFCQEHPDLNFEMTAEGEIVVMAPTHSETSAANFEIARQLGSWIKTDGRGVGCDSSGGFVLPNGARRSPDASWTLKSRLTALTKKQRHKGFWPLCPDFVIEVRSDSDRLRTLRNKMHEYLENGAQLGWLIDPSNQSVEVYRPNGEVTTYTGITELHGEGPVADFTLNLVDIWDLLA